MKRVIDCLLAGTLFILTLPLMLFAIVGIKLCSTGPVMYYALRVGMDGKTFKMLKFRSMHETSAENKGAVITSKDDKRVFIFGWLLRKTKVDELPQLLNVLIGNMSIVGPRPEDPRMVELYYTDWMKVTLSVRPGITSPGAIFYYATSDNLIDVNDPEGSYATLVLPAKMAVERAYLDRANWLSDLVCILHTGLAIFGKIVNYPVLPLAGDLSSASKWVNSSAFCNVSKESKR